MLPELGLLRGKNVIPGKLLLFPDEIQACPPALAMLAYSERKDLHEVKRIQGALMHNLQADFAKYEPHQLHEPT